MKYGSLCSGVGGCTLAFSSMGWETAFFSEIDQFAAEVLCQRFPNVPNIGDFTNHGPREKIDLLVGGTPCQSFSMSGKRLGLDDSRGNLAINFIEFGRECNAQWLVWENVCGVLSANKGQDFGRFLRTLADSGYGFAYRVLDARHFGTPQRRRRLFVVGYLGDWRPPAAVLFNQESLQWDPAKGKKTRKKNTGGNFVPTGDTESIGDIPRLYVFNTRQDFVHSSPYSLPLGAKDRGHGLYRAGEALRRLTPLECERLQGMPDNHTLIAWKGRELRDCPNGHRYRVIGNAFCVDVVKAIGRRIEGVELVLGGNSSR